MEETKPVLKPPKILNSCDCETLNPLKILNLCSMASRAASRTVRSAFRSARNPFRHAEGTNRSRPITFPAKNSGETAIFRRRCVKSMIPLHNAVASAKLVSHLSVSSRTCSALSLGLQSYVHAPFHALCIARGTLHL